MSLFDKVIRRRSTVPPPAQVGPQDSESVSQKEGQLMPDNGPTDQKTPSQVSQPSFMDKLFRRRSTLAPTAEVQQETPKLPVNPEPAAPMTTNRAPVPVGPAQLPTNIVQPSQNAGMIIGAEAGMATGAGMGAGMVDGMIAGNLIGQRVQQARNHAFWRNRAAQYQ